MPIEYRMVHVEPFRINIEMATASGWVFVESAQTLAQAKEVIRQRKEKETWVVQVYDESGNVVETRVSPNQSVVNA